MHICMNKPPMGLKWTCGALTQVSNWFINARVRLWKPMVEEMYLEEQKEAEEAEASGRMQEKADEADSGNNNFRQYEGGKGY